MNELNNDSVSRLQAAMIQLPQIEPETLHFFADGMYARVLFHPAGVTIVGKMHKREHFYIVTKGRVAIKTDGQQARIYEAGDVIVSSPGTKRALYAIEDCTYMTVHRTKKRNLDGIEKQLIEPGPALFDASNKLKAKELT